MENDQTEQIAFDNQDAEHASQFFECYGRTMLAWQKVEMNLFFIFNALVRAHDYNITSAVYHSVGNMNTKLEIITEVVKTICLDGQLSSEWIKLRKRVNSNCSPC